MSREYVYFGDEKLLAEPMRNLLIERGYGSKTAAIAREAGVNRRTTKRLMNMQFEFITVKSADRLAKALGTQLTTIYRKYGAT